MSVTQILNLIRAHSRKPLLGFLREVCGTLVLAGSCDDGAFWEAAANELLQFGRRFVGVERHSLLDAAVRRIEDDDVQASGMVVFILVNFDDDVVLENFGKVATFVAGRRCLDQDQLRLC